MDYDPAWDMPQPNWVQQGSFESGEIPPAVDPTAGEQICVGPFAREWLPVVLGALDQLRNPSSWIVADDAAMYTTLRRVDMLREIIAVSEGCTLPVMMRLESDCILQYSNDGGATWVDTTDWDANFGNCVRADVPVPVPPNPGDDRIQLHACNIAGYIATKFIEVCIEKIVAYIGTSGQQLTFAQSVMSTLVGTFPLTTGFVNSLVRFYDAVISQVLAEVENTRDDATLWSDVTCAIYAAIRSVGYVDNTNFAAVAANLGAISTPHAWFVPVMVSLWNDLGVDGIRALQVVGAIDVIDCSACITPVCQSYDFSQSDGGWTAESVTGIYQTGPFGTGWYQQPVSGGRISVRLHSPLFPTGFICTGVVLTLAGANPLTVSGERDVAPQNPCGVTNLDVAAYSNLGMGGSTTITVPVTTSASTRCVVVNYDSDNGAFAAGAILKVQLQGTGVNPVGPDNCPP